MNWKKEKYIEFPIYNSSWIDSIKKLFKKKKPRPICGKCGGQLSDDDLLLGETPHGDEGIYYLCMICRHKESDSKLP